MNAYKPLIIFNVMQSIELLSEGSDSFRRFLIEGTRPNEKRIAELVGRSLMLVTALSPAIGYDKAAEIAHLAAERDMTLKQAALELGYVTEEEFDRLVDPAKMVGGVDASGA
jgi:fumarate hydratase class II